MIFFVAALHMMAGPGPQAESLGRQLAAASGLATLAPHLIERDLADLSKEAATASPSEQARLLVIGRAEGRRGLDHLIDALGHAYAKRLSVEDLRRLVADSATPAAKHRREIEPAALMETLTALGGLDLKKNVARQLCQETGKLCNR